MINNQYISLVLFFIIAVTLFNLFYKQALFDRSTPDDLEVDESATFNRITQTMCPLQGLKCNKFTYCDCEKICGTNYTKFTVTNEESIFIINRKLTPGTYCLPKGFLKCNFKAHFVIFSLMGWSCLTKNTTIFKKDYEIACQNDEAADNSLNVLWDNLENKPAKNIENYYERMDNGELRYGCKCNSKSLDGAPMISPVPFVCTVDYCVRDFKNPIPGMGWNGSTCDCAMYPHLLTNDKASPCRREVSRREKNLYIGRVKCMTKNSYIKSALYCPGDDDVMYFHVPSMLMLRFQGDPSEYVDRFVQPKNYGLEKNPDVELYYNTVNADPLKHAGSNVEPGLIAIGKKRAISYII